ncbi:MAG: 4a-hydroxytetrahydrobiopterin dehydratase [Patescibacteria group bacterium]
MSAPNLVHQKCVPCEGGTKPLTRSEFQIYLDSVKDWNVIQNETAIQKEFLLKNFKEVISFVNRIAEIAEEEGHHPDLNIHDYKKLTITLTTHAISGLSINDFILAAKIDRLLD